MLKLNIIIFLSTFAFVDTKLSSSFRHSIFRSGEMFFAVFRCFFLLLVWRHVLLTAWH